jgi:hypothetical protein
MRGGLGRFGALHEGNFTLIIAGKLVLPLCLPRLRLGNTYHWITGKKSVTREPLLLNKGPDRSGVPAYHYDSLPKLLTNLGRWQLIGITFGGKRIKY